MLQALYTNVNGLGDAWASMWKTVALTFKGAPYILGLELLNEPFAGNFYRHPWIMAPWPNPFNADAFKLQPAYDRVNEAIRTVDRQRLIFFSGVTWGHVGPGFTAPPGGPEYANRSVLSYHYYSPPQRDPEQQVRRQLAGAQRLQTGIFLSESSGGSSHSNSIYDAAEAQSTGWAYWQYKTMCRESRTSIMSQSQYGVFCARAFSLYHPPTR